MIQRTDKSFAPTVQDRIDNLNKPKGSLGRLESLALQVALVQHTLTPRLVHPCHILFGADHGIEREGVSVSPREVTWQQMKNYGRGGGGVNMFCRQHGFSLRVVDVGVDYDFDSVECPHIIDRKIAYGTRNFLYEAAMTEEEWNRALAVGAEHVDECHAEGCNVIAFGEMGIGNTSPSSILMHLLLDIPLVECVAAAVGAMLRAAEQRMIILVDGFIMSACMLAASRMDEAVLDYAVFGHCGDESGHRRMLTAMGASPLLSLGLRLGEGTGALCAYPIVESAVNMLNEMDTFSHVSITKYF